MKITKENNYLVLRIPLTQESFDAGDQYIGDVPRLIGTIHRKKKYVEFAISYLVDLGYKGVQQEGLPIINFYDEKEFKNICKKLGLDIWENFDD